MCEAAHVCLYVCLDSKSTNKWLGRIYGPHAFERTGLTFLQQRCQQEWVAPARVRHVGAASELRSCTEVLPPPC